MIVRPFVPEMDMDMVRSAKVRKEDAEELYASRGMDFNQYVDAVCGCPQILNDTYIIEEDDQLIAIGGLVTSIDNVGLPWFIATELIEKYPIQTFKIMKAMLAIWKRHTKSLLNWVDIRNEKAIRFLDRLGFKWVKGFFFEGGGTHFQAFVMKGDMHNV